MHLNSMALYFMTDDTRTISSPHHAIQNKNRP